jgi:hypothetical protein
MYSLLQRLHPLAAAAEQRAMLERVPIPVGFEQALAASGLAPLRPTRIDILQINIGKLCNQTCRHCHVDAGPDRREVMPPAMVDACLQALESSAIPTLDITGGAPELHPQFRDIVRRGREIGRRVIDRCNLTILLVPAQADLPEFLARWRVEIVASLPSPNLRQTDAQRGAGVFERSIYALRRLNAAGYGVDPELSSPVTNRWGFLRPAIRRLRPTGSAICGAVSASSSTICTRSPTCRSAATSST